MRLDENGSGLSTGWSKDSRARKPGKPKTSAVLLGLAAAVFVPVQASLAAATQAWLPQGPAPIVNAQVQNIIPTNPACGAIRAVAAHPTNPNLFYIGAVNGGIWRTTNATSLIPTWQPLTDFLPSLSIGALTLDPTDPTGRTIVAGVGRLSSLLGSGGALTGILRSTNGGDSWTQLGQPTLLDKNISSVVARGNLIMAGADDIFGGGIGSGLFRSANGGLTFQQVSGGSGLPLGPVSDVVRDPGNSNRFYCALRQTGVFRSDNAGVSWVNVTPGITNISAVTHTVKLSVHSSAGTNAVYAGVLNFDGNTFGDLDIIYRSTNLGNIWTVMGAPNASPVGQGYIQFSIVADPHNPNLVYVGGDEGPLFRGDASLPEGSQFTWIIDSFADPDGAGPLPGTGPHADSRCLVFDAAGNLIETDDGGIYRRSSPQSRTGTWTSVIGNLQLTEFHSIGYDHNAHIIIGGTQDNGTVQQFTPGSLVWDTVYGTDGGNVAVDETSAPGYSIRYVSGFALTAFQRITYDANNHFVSNAVPTLTVTTGGMTPSYFTYTPVVLNAIDPHRLIIGAANTFYESFDQGNHITDIAFGFQVNVDSFAGTPIAYGGMAGGIPNADVLYVCIADTVRVRTSGSGFTSPTPAAFPGGPAHAVMVDRDNWHRAFVLGETNIYLSPDAGASWTDITGNLTGVGNLRCEEFIRGAGGGAVVVGTDAGVYVSFAANLGTWNQLGASLPNAPVYDLHYDSVDDVLVAGTLGRGAWLLPGVSTQLAGLLPQQLSQWTLTNGFFSFRLNGLVGSNYVIQISSNLLVWTPLLTNSIPAAGNVVVTDPLPANQSRRFYRAVFP